MTSLSKNHYPLCLLLDRPDSFNFHIKVNTRNSRQEMIKCIQILRDHSGIEDDVEKTEIAWDPVIEDSSYQVFSTAHLSQQGYEG